jgi:hypothetical protein
MSRQALLIALTANNSRIVGNTEIIPENLLNALTRKLTSLGERILESRRRCDTRLVFLPGALSVRMTISGVPGR